MTTTRMAKESRRVCNRNARGGTRSGQVTFEELSDVKEDLDLRGGTDVGPRAASPVHCAPAPAVGRALVPGDEPT